MQILRGTKRQITLMQWNEQLEKAKKRLADSTKCQELFGDHEEWVEIDKNKLEEVEQNMKKAIKYMDAHNIK